MSADLRDIYEFAGFRFEPANRRLIRPTGETVSLTPKEFDVLLVLVRNGGSVVSKDTLLEAVWKDTFVAEETMMRNISWLRKKLGERIIETVPKIGYRLAVDVRTIRPSEVVVEERSIQRVIVEETVTVDDPPAVGAPAAKLLAAPVRKRIGLGWWIALTLLVLMAAAAAGYWLIVRRLRNAPLLVAKIAPFTGSIGREDMPSFSSDGNKLTFVWNGGEGGNPEVYVKSIGAGDPLRLTNTPQIESSPIFTPDGSQVLFVRYFSDHDEVVTVPVFGGAERKICSLASTRASISISPDGRLLALVDQSPVTKRTGLFTLDLASGARELVKVSGGGTGDNAPRFSPDGRRIAFLRAFGDFVQEVMVVTLASGETRQLTADSSRVHGLAWSSDTLYLIFISLRQNNQRNLWRIPVEGGDAQLIVTGGKDIANLASSPDGKTLAYAETWDDSNIWRLTSDAPAQTVIASTRADHSPNLSPDGARVVFASERSGDGAIWIADADGKNARALTDGKEPAGSPRFSPDGRSVAYDVQLGGSSDICTISVDGGAARRLTDDPKRDALPSWSADGNWIYFASNRGGPYNLWKMPATGGPATQLTKHEAFESFAAPDGKWVYFSKGRNLKGLWRVSVDGGDEMAVPELADAGFWRFWTVAGTGLYYLAFGEAAPYRLKRFDLVSGETREVLTTDKSPLDIYSGLAASADGKFLLYAHSDRIGSNIMLVQLR